MTPIRLICHILPSQNDLSVAPKKLIKAIFDGEHYMLCLEVCVQSDFEGFRITQSGLARRLFLNSERVQNLGHGQNLVFYPR